MSCWDASSCGALGIGSSLQPPVDADADLFIRGPRVEQSWPEADLRIAISTLISAWICLHSRIFCRASGVSLARLAFNADALAAAS